MADDTPSTPPSSMSPSTDRTGSLSPAGSTPSVAPTSADLPAQMVESGDGDLWPDARGLPHGDQDWCRRAFT